MKEFFTSRFQTVADYFSTQSFALQDFGNIFSWDFWVEAGIEPTSEYTVLVLILVALLLAGVAVWRKKLKKQHATTPVYDWPLNQLLNIQILIVMIALSYWFFHSQQLAYLSSRLVILISIIIVLGWIGWVVIHLQRVSNTKRVAYLEKERFFRYLPKSKKVRN